MVQRVSEKSHFMTSKVQNLTLKRKKCLSYLKYISAFDNDVKISSETSSNSSGSEEN